MTSVNDTLIHKAMSSSKNIRPNYYFIVGIILSCLNSVPYLILGQDSLLRIHDTFDVFSTLFVTLVKSGKAFELSATIDNIMNGLPHSAFVSPFYAVIWLLLIFKPFIAFVINDLIVHLVAFTGMFLLLRTHLLKNKEDMPIIFGSSLCFAFIPVMPLFGLSAAGLPLLLYAFLNLLNKRNKRLSYVIISFFPFYSSLVLSGVFVFTALAILLIWDFWKSKRVNINYLVGLVILIVGYSIVEYGIIGDFIFNNNFISQRSEWNLHWYSLNFKEAIRQAISVFVHTQNHSVSLQTPILFSFIFAGILLIAKNIQKKRYVIFTLISAVAAFSLSVCLCYYIWNGAIPKETISGMEYVLSSLTSSLAVSFKPFLGIVSKYLFFILVLSSFFMIIILSIMASFANIKLNMGKNATLLLLIIVILLGISLFQGLFIWEGLIPLKESIPLLRGFQMDRFYFLQPTLWYMLFAMSLFIISRIRYGKYIVLLFIGFQMYYLVVNNNSNYNQLLSNVNTSYRKIKGANIEPEGLTYRKYFSENLFKDIKDYIAIPQKEYRVVSIGLHPCISTYNGFYALDGYIANYPLEYKHQFRKIIENELAKSKKWQEYFDFYGNRCYIFIAELDKFWFENTKDNHYQITNMELNIDQLKSMGGKYILSVFRIMNEADNGLVLMKIFERDDSPWRIHLYKVK